MIFEARSTISAIYPPSPFWQCARKPARPVQSESIQRFRSPFRTRLPHSMYLLDFFGHCARKWQASRRARRNGWRKRPFHLVACSYPSIQTGHLSVEAPSFPLWERPVDWAQFWIELRSVNRFLQEGEQPGIWQLQAETYAQAAMLRDTVSCRTSLIVHR